MSQSNYISFYLNIKGKNINFIKSYILLSLIIDFNMKCHF